MSIEVYYGRKFSHTHEKRAFKQFLRDTLDCFEPDEKLFCIVTEPLIYNASIDMLLINQTSLFIVEFKNLGQAEDDECDRIKIIGNENDSWNYRLPNGLKIPIGSVDKWNPYRQMSSHRYSVIDWLVNHTSSLRDGRWSNRKAEKQVYGWVVISPGFDGDKSQLDMKWDELKFKESPGYWFDVVPVGELADRIDSAPEKNSLYDNEIRALIDQMGVSKEENYRKILPGFEFSDPLFIPPPRIDTLIGRNTQKQELLNTFDSPCNSTILIQGIGGVGRTALSGWFATQAKNRNYRTLWIDCNEKSSITLDFILAAIALKVTNLSRSLIQNPEKSLTDRMDAALDFLNQRPTLLIFDDYHLLKNRSSINQFISRASRYRDNLKIIITYRERIVDPTWVTDSTLIMDIPGLEYEEFRLFVNAKAHYSRLGENELHFIWQRLSGIPEAFLLSDSLIRQYQLMEKLTGLPIPDTTDWFNSLFDILSPDAQKFTQCLSIIRRRLNLKVIQKVSQVGVIDAARLIMELLDKYYLQELETPNEFIMPEFIRFSFTNRMAEKMRIETHQRARDCFASLAGEALEEMQKIEYLLEAIYHDELGGQSQLFLKHSADVYELLQKIGDADQAYSVAEKALAWALKNNEMQQKYTWLLILAEQELRWEHSVRAIQLVDEGFVSFPKFVKKITPEAKKRWQGTEAQLWILRGRAFYLYPDYENASQSFIKGLEIARAVGIQDLIAKSLMGLARIERNRKEYDHSIDHLNEVIQIAEQLKDNRLLCDGFSHLGYIARSKHEYEDAHQWFNKANEIALLNRDSFANIVTLAALGRTELFLENYTDAERIFRNCLKLAMDLRETRGIRFQLTNLVESLICLQKFDEAETYLLESERLNQEAKDGLGTAWNLKHRGQIIRARGHLEQGTQLIQQGLDILNEIGNKEFLGEFEEALQHDIQLKLGLV